MGWKVGLESGDWAAWCLRSLRFINYPGLNRIARIAEFITVALWTAFWKGTVQFLSNESWDAPHFFIRQPLTVRRQRDQPLLEESGDRLQPNAGIPSTLVDHAVRLNPTRGGPPKPSATFRPNLDSGKPALCLTPPQNVTRPRYRLANRSTFINWRPAVNGVDADPSTTSRPNISEIFPSEWKKTNLFFRLEDFAIIAIEGAGTIRATFPGRSTSPSFVPQSLRKATPSTSLSAQRSISSAGESCRTANRPRSSWAPWASSTKAASPSQQSQTIERPHPSDHANTNRLVAWLGLYSPWRIERVRAIPSAAERRRFLPASPSGECFNSAVRQCWGKRAIRIPNVGKIIRFARFAVQTLAVDLRNVGSNDVARIADRHLAEFVGP